ncbi:MAG: hypothetical protein PPP58_06940 [Natronomonas sp.]
MGNRSLDEFLGESSDSGDTEGVSGSAELEEVGGSDGTEGTADPDDIEETGTKNSKKVEQTDTKDPKKVEQTGEEDSGAAVRPTYDWTVDGTDCAVCGVSVQCRFRDDRGMVCSDCKAW